MNVDLPSNDQPIFSLNVDKIRHTAAAPISAFTTLKLSIPQLKNKLTGLFHDLPGFLSIKLG